MSYLKWIPKRWTQQWWGQWLYLISPLSLFFCQNMQDGRVGNETNGDISMSLLSCENKIFLQLLTEGLPQHIYLTFYWTVYFQVSATEFYIAGWKKSVWTLFLNMFLFPITPMLYNRFTTETALQTLESRLISHFLYIRAFVGGLSARAERVWSLLLTMFLFAVTPIFILLLSKRCITETTLQRLMILRGWQRLLPNIWKNKRIN